MVHLDRIYTKAGDAGETRLASGERVAKTHPRIRAGAVVDELNSVLGLAIAMMADSESASVLASVQNDLFDVGADLSVPESNAGDDDKRLRITAGQVERLEHQIDDANQQLEPLTSFVLPGGSPVAAHLHHARTVCRRAEINVWELAEQEAVNPEVPKYLNRLSDLLFVLARLFNNGGKDDVLWQPGQTAGE